MEPAEIQRTVERIAENSPIWYMAWKPASLGAEVFTESIEKGTGTDRPDRSQSHFRWNRKAIPDHTAEVVQVVLTGVSDRSARKSCQDR